MKEVMKMLERLTQEVENLRASLAELKPKPIKPRRKPIADILPFKQP